MTYLRLTARERWRVVESMVGGVPWLRLPLVVAMAVWTWLWWHLWWPQTHYADELAAWVRRTAAELDGPVDSKAGAPGFGADADR